MCPPRSLEQKRAARIALAGALAEQWFGQLLVPETAADEWLLWGLQCYVQVLFVKAAFGASEAMYLRLRQRDAVRLHAVLRASAVFEGGVWRQRGHVPAAAAARCGAAS